MSKLQSTVGRTDSTNPPFGDEPLNASIIYQFEVSFAFARQLRNHHPDQRATRSGGEQFDGDSNSRRGPIEGL
jgi:hypothetical protein